MKGRPPFENFYPYLLFIFLGYCLADLSSLYIRSYMIPDRAPTTKEAAPFVNEQQPKGAYNTIITRNIFNADGTIPDALAAKSDSKPKGEEIPVPSNLPLNLIGTIVHSKSEKSIANIELRGKNQVFAFTPNRDIDKIATLIKVERNKAIIRNQNNGRLEFIQSKDLSKLSFQASKPSSGGIITGPANVKQVAPNKFEINGADLDRQLADVSSLLMQASSIPKKGPNGEIRCYTILGIQPGGVFAQLGISNGDCIKSVNGEAIDSPAKAIELFNTLKGASNLRLGYEREGRDNENDYTIRR